MSLIKLTKFKMTGMYLLIGILFLVTMVSISYGNNGKIAYAYPIENIQIDGDLSDWSDEIARFPINKSFNTKLKNDRDFRAFFRVAYSMKNQSLYFAVEVFDDSHIVAKGKNIGWDQQDRYLLYVDKQHLRGGSGNVLYDVTYNSREVSSARNSWDPVNKNANWDNIEFKISRTGVKTVAEWRIHLGDYIYPNRTIGIDHYLVDKDAGESGSASILWGEGFSKSAISGRMGDVVLMAPNSSLGEIRGKLKWKRNIKEPLPTKVRLTSVKNPKLWVQTNVDKEGNYAVKLPEGGYIVDSPFTLTQPFAVNFKVKPLRIESKSKVRAQIKVGKLNKADMLELETIRPPEHLFKNEGVLHTYDSSKAAMIDDFIEKYREYYRVPGVSVALVKDGRVVYHKTFGVKNNLTKEKVDESTLFEAASITKPVFAFAVMRLAERGMIDLDKPLYEYFPFKNIAEDERSKLLTARIILSHKSGLPNWAFGGPGGWVNGGKIKLNFKPGEKFAYSGEGYNYLGRVLEKITGKKLNQILKDEVLKPMGMTNTYFSNNAKLAKVASIGHNHYLPAFWGITNLTSPASSMHTEAKDFAKFMIGLMEKKGLSKKTYAEMLKTHTAILPKDRVYDNGWMQSLALGYFLEDTPYGRLIQHGGNNGDFHCKFGIIPEKKIGYAIYSNNNVGDKLNRAFERFVLYGNTVKN